MTSNCLQLNKILFHSYLLKISKSFDGISFDSERRYFHRLEFLRLHSHQEHLVCLWVYARDSTSMFGFLCPLCDILEIKEDLICFGGDMGCYNGEVFCWDSSSICDNVCLSVDWFVHWSTTTFKFQLNGYKSFEACNEYLIFEKFIFI